MLFGGKRPLLCGGYALLSRHELCRIYVLFWSGFDADFYADIEDFVQILCRFLHKKISLEALVPKRSLLAHFRLKNALKVGAVTIY